MLTFDMSHRLKKLPGYVKIRTQQETASLKLHRPSSNEQVQ